jgi:predicted DNA-binding protein
MHRQQLLTNVPRCSTLYYVRKKLTAIRLKPEQVEKLERLSVRQDVPVSWLIRKAIDEFLKRQK